MLKKTRLVCTMGPACDNEETLRKMMENGMNVARFNFSHGSYEEHLGRYNRVVKVRDELKLPVATLFDSKGPEIRFRLFEGSKVTINDGDLFTLTTREILGNNTIGSISYKNLINDVQIGTSILVNDGLIELKVEKVGDTDIVCRVINGGVISDRKAINVPGVHLSLPFLSDVDRRDLEFAMKTGFDFFALSFVRCAEDVLEVRRLQKEHNNTSKLIAKIESQEGVENLDAIIDVADGIMVARGDMGVEIPFIKLPEIQKTIIRKVVSRGKYVITATQMLESMTTAPRPTRAEISDVANAVYDGTSAVMLSAESAAGRYPIESVKALDAICSEAEENGEFTALHEYVEEHGMKDTNPIRSSICKAAKNIAQAVGAKAIIVESATGRVARAMVHYRPDCPVIAVATSQLVCRKLCLNWGVMAVMGEEKRTSDSITKQAMEKALSTGVVKKGDTVVVLSSNKTCPTSSTDSLNVRIL